MQGTSNCGGLISGNLVVTHKGNLDVHAHDMGLTMRLTFKEPGMFSGKRGCKHEVGICHCVFIGGTLSGGFLGCGAHVSSA